MLSTDILPVYDFDIASLHNASIMLTQCAFNVTVLTCKSEMYSHWGLRILSRQSVTVFEMAAMYVLYKLPLYSANPKLDWFCHVMKSITKNKHPEVCVCGV